MPDDPQKQYSSGLWDYIKGNTAGMADHFGPGYGSKELTPEEELAIFNDQGPSPLTMEQIWDLYRQGKTKEEIGLAMHPNREKLVKSGGRLEPKEWVKKANDLAKRSEAQQSANEPDMSAQVSSVGGGSNGTLA